MKKHLLFCICLLATISIEAQEVSREMHPKNLRQGLNTQSMPFKYNFPASLKSLSEKTGEVRDSFLQYNYNLHGDSVLIYKEYNKYNSDGTYYFTNSLDLIGGVNYKRHNIYNESGNPLSTIEKVNNMQSGINDWDWNYQEEFGYDSIGNEIIYKNYIWDVSTDKWINNYKSEMEYDSNGRRIQNIRKQWNTNSNDWYITKWEMYYQEEITYPTMSSVQYWWERKAGNSLYSWYYWEKSDQNLWFTSDEGEYDTLTVIYTWNKEQSIWIDSLKERREFDDNGYMTLAEAYEWLDDRWVPKIKQEFQHGPDGQDTIYRGYRWDISRKVWYLSSEDTIIWYETGGWKEVKFGHLNELGGIEVLHTASREYDKVNNRMVLKEFGWERPINVQDYENINIFDINYNVIFTEDKYFDEVGIYNGGYKSYGFYSLPDNSKDASLWEAGVNGGKLIPKINGVPGYDFKKFNDEVKDYLVIIDNTTVTPPISLIKNDPNSFVIVKDAKNIISANKEDRTSIVRVLAEDFITTMDYSFEFKIADGCSTLDTLIVDRGKLSPDFNPEIFVYYDTICGGCPGTSTPLVSAETTSPFATLSITPATNVCATWGDLYKTNVTVVADNDCTNVYTINFSVKSVGKCSHVCTLDSLKVIGWDLNPDFSSEIVEYNIDIYGSCDSTIITPLVTYVLTNPLAKASVSYAMDICDPQKSKTVITVLAEDGITTKQYEISYTVIVIKNINQVSLKNLLIYPNPATDLLELKHDSPMIEVTIFNIFGQKVREYRMDSVTSGEISLAGLKQGIYLIWVEDEKGRIHISKLLKD